VRNQFEEDYSTLQGGMTTSTMRTVENCWTVLWNVNAARSQ